MNRGKPEKGLPLGNYKNALAKSGAKSRNSIRNFYTIELKEQGRRLWNVVLMYGSLNSPTRAILNPAQNFKSQNNY